MLSVIMDGECVIDIDGQGREDLMVATNLWP